MYQDAPVMHPPRIVSLTFRLFPGHHPVHSGTGQRNKRDERELSETSSRLPVAIPSSMVPTRNEMTNRRQFLKHFSQFGAATVLAPGALLAEGIRPRGRLRLRPVPLEQLTFAAFAYHLHRSFTVYADVSTAVEMQLVEATPSVPASPQAWAAPDAGNEKFSLIFRGPPEPFLPQSIYLFEHEEIGRFGMFVAPIGSSDPEHYYYQAIFNRPRRSWQAGSERTLH